MTHTNARVLPQQYISKRNGSLFSQRDTACTSCALYSRRQWQGRRQPWGISTVHSWVQSLSRNSLGCKKLSQSNSSTHKVGLLLEFTSRVPQNTRLILLFTVGEGLDSSHGCMMVYHSIQLDVEQGELSTSFRFRACLDHFRFTFFLDCKDSQKAHYTKKFWIPTFLVLCNLRHLPSPLSEHLHPTDHGNMSWVNWLAWPCPGEAGTLITRAFRTC